jgi:NAD(P)-dependent dehydrogenase (short-subunit alcohol dehydrogenase family)
MPQRAALITGSTKGIGLAIAESLVASGASVVINGRKQHEVDAVVARLSQSATGVVGGIAADVGTYLECERLVAESAAALDGLDVVINNAGLGVLKPIEQLTWEEWRLQIDVNLGGVWGCTKAAIPHLKQSADAWVINIGSLASRNSFANGTGYNASKFGLLGMTEAMMLDLRQHGIRVSIVMPGTVNTDFSGHGSPGRDWRLQAEDCALAVMQLLEFPKGAHVSRIEMRPARPDSR